MTPLPRLSAFITGALTAALALSLNAAARAGDLEGARPAPRIVVHPRHAAYPHDPFPPYEPYYPFYYSRWNPYSLYSVYDHLSGGRQLCYLPTDPCDNNHRITN
jgi:hypothetical protein